MDKKGKQRQKIGKQNAAEICLLGNTSNLCLQWNLTSVSYCLWRRLRREAANMDCVIRLVSSISVESGAICWAPGLQNTLPKFHRLLLIWQLIKKKYHSHTGDPEGTQACIWILSGRGREGKDQGVSFMKSNLKSKWTRQVRMGQQRCADPWSETRRLLQRATSLV